MYISDEDLMNGLNICDCCQKKENSFELFWNYPDWEDETNNQKVVSNYMIEHEYDAVCMDCFYTITGEENVSS